MPLADCKRIVCFHMNQVGDLLFALPAVYSLRQRFPNARITSVVRSNCYDLAVLSRLPDEVRERPRGGFTARVALAVALRRTHPDLAVLFSASFETWILALFSGAKTRAGFSGPATSRMLGCHVPKIDPPSTENNLRLVKAIGCPVTKRDYVGLIRPGESEFAAGDRLLDSIGVTCGEPVAVLSPSTSPRREIKRWTDNGFAEVADRLKAELGLTPVVVGMDGSGGICRLSEHARDLTGKTSLGVLAAVLSRAKVLVGIDSGVMHLAAAVGTPAVALFGPTDPRITGPQGDGHRVLYTDMPCRPCLRNDCDIGRSCILGITSDMVLSAAASVAIGNPV